MMDDVRPYRVDAGPALAKVAVLRTRLDDLARARAQRRRAWRGGRRARGAKRAR